MAHRFSGLCGSILFLPLPYLGVQREALRPYEHPTDNIPHRPKRQGFKPNHDDAESRAPDEEDDIQKKAVDADVVVETLPVNRP